MRSAIALLACFMLTLALAVPLGADCPEVLNLDDPPCVPTATYYTVLLEEPSWCPYTYGDWIFIRNENINGHLTATGWYVVPSSDTTSHPPSSFPDQYAEEVVGNNCNVIWLPW